MFDGTRDPIFQKAPENGWRWLTKTIVPGLALAVLAGCAGGGATGTQIGPTSSDKGYTFKCGAVPSVNDWSAELNLVQPQPRLGGTVKVVLPPAGVDLSSACLNAMFEARIEAIRRAGFFDAIDVRHDGNGFRPENQEEGFWIWVEDGNFVASYGKAIRFSLPNKPPRLEGWVTGLKTVFDNLKKTADAGSNAIALTTVGLSNYYGYRGVEYLTFDELRTTLMDEAASTATRTQKVKEIGLRALVVIPPEKSVVATWTTSAKAVPNAAINLGLTLGTNAYAGIVGQAKAFERSGLFRQAVIEEKDVTDPDDGGYDAVIWMRSSDTGKWYMRLKGHNTVPFKALVTNEPNKWVSAVMDAAVRARADGR